MTNKTDAEIDGMIDDQLNELIAHIYVKVEKYFEQINKNINNRPRRDRFLKIIEIEVLQHYILKIIKEAKS